MINAQKKRELRTALEIMIDLSNDTIDRRTTFGRDGETLEELETEELEGAVRLIITHFQDEVGIKL